MRNHLDLPDDLPCPFGLPVRASTSVPTTKPARCVAPGVWEDPTTGRWACYGQTPSCSPHTNAEMFRRDHCNGDEALAQEMTDAEGHLAEGVAIRQLDVETADAEAHFKATLMQDEVGSGLVAFVAGSGDRFNIIPDNADAVGGNGYVMFTAAGERKRADARRKEHLGQMHVACNPAASGGDETVIFAAMGNDKTATAVRAIMDGMEHQMQRAMGIPSDFLAANTRQGKRSKLLASLWSTDLEPSNKVKHFTKLELILAAQEAADADAKAITSTDSVYPSARPSGSQMNGRPLNRTSSTEILRTIREGWEAGVRLSDTHPFLLELRHRGVSV